MEDAESANISQILITNCIFILLLPKSQTKRSQKWFITLRQVNCKTGYIDIIQITMKVDKKHNNECFDYVIKRICLMFNTSQHKKVFVSGCQGREIDSRGRG